MHKLFIKTQNKINYFLRREMAPLEYQTYGGYVQV